MEESLTDTIVRKIVNTISRETFYEWYIHGRFNDWLGDSKSGVTDEQIKADVIRMFDLDIHLTWRDNTNV